MAQGTRSMQVSGLESFEAAFDVLADYAQKDVINDGLRVGAEMVRQEAQELVPEDEGKLKRAIRVRAERKRPGSFSVVTGVGRRWFAGDEFYGGFQNFGWLTGKRGSENRKQVPGEHFMEHAFESKAQAATDAVTKELWAGVERELALASKLKSA